MFIDLIYSEPILIIPFKTETTSSFFPNHYEPVTRKYMSQIVTEILIGKPSQKLNCSLKLLSYHSLFLSHKIKNIELTSFYNKNKSLSYICNNELTDYSNEDFDRAESFCEKIQFYSAENKKYLTII